MSTSTANNFRSRGGAYAERRRAKNQGLGAAAAFDAAVKGGAKNTSHFQPPRSLMCLPKAATLTPTDKVQEKGARILDAVLGAAKKAGQHERIQEFTLATGNHPSPSMPKASTSAVFDDDDNVNMVKQIKMQSRLDAGQVSTASRSITGYSDIAHCPTDVQPPPPPYRISKKDTRTIDQPSLATKGTDVVNLTGAAEQGQNLDSSVDVDQGSTDSVDLDSVDSASVDLEQELRAYNSDVAGEAAKIPKTLGIRHGAKLDKLKIDTDDILSGSHGCDKRARLATDPAHSNSLLDAQLVSLSQDSDPADVVTRTDDPNTCPRNEQLVSTLGSTCLTASTKFSNLDRRHQTRSSKEPNSNTAAWLVPDIDMVAGNSVSVANVTVRSTTRCTAAATATPSLFSDIGSQGESDESPVCSRTAKATKPTEISPQDCYGHASTSRAAADFSSSSAGVKRSNLNRPAARAKDNKSSVLGLKVTHVASGKVVVAATVGGRNGVRANNFAVADGLDSSDASDRGFISVPGRNLPVASIDAQKIYFPGSHESNTSLSQQQARTFVSNAKRNFKLPVTAKSENSAKFANVQSSSVTDSGTEQLSAVIKPRRKLLARRADNLNMDCEPSTSPYSDSPYQVTTRPPIKTVAAPRTLNQSRNSPLNSAHQLFAEIFGEDEEIGPKSAAVNLLSNKNRSLDDADSGSTSPVMPRSNIFDRIKSPASDNAESRLKPAEDDKTQFLPSRLRNGTTNRRQKYEVTLIYPEGQRGAVTLSMTDVACLAPGEFLNDNIIDFYLKYLAQNYPDGDDESLRDKIHLFPTFFWERMKAVPLRDREKTETLEEWSQDRWVRARDRHKAVEKWTKNIDLFQKDFIVFPINEFTHWYLAIVCYAHAALESSQGENTDASGPETDVTSHRSEPTASDASQQSSASSTQQTPKIKPRIVIFDSLNEGNTHISAVHVIQEYLSVEYEARCGTQFRFTDNRVLMGSYPKVMRQPNCCDCGIFLLQYAEEFFKNPSSILSPKHNNLEKWFSRSVVTNKREDLILLIRQLSTAWKATRTDSSGSSTNNDHSADNSGDVEVVEDS